MGDGEPGNLSVQTELGGLDPGSTFKAIELINGA